MDIYRTKPRPTIAIAAALVVVAGVACDDDAGTAPASEAPKPVRTSKLGGDALGRERITMKLVDNAFRPSDPSVAGGEVVTFLLRNTGDNRHTFTVPELDIDVELRPLQKSRVDLEIPDAGEFDFYCRIHRAEGMTGTITVE